MFIAAGALACAAAALAAGWVAAQPTSGTLATQPRSTTTFRRAAQIRIPDSQVSRSEIIRARTRPAAVALRSNIARTAASRVDLAAVDRTSVPVLVTARPSMVANLRVFTRPNSFSASAKEPGMTLVIDGSKTATAAPPTFRLPRTATLRLAAAAMVISPTVPRRDAERAVRSAQLSGAASRSRASEVTGVRPPVAPAQPPPAPLQDVVVEPTEYGIDISFVRFGAVYNVSVACDDPARDARCSQAGAEGLVRQLETIGGGETPQ